MKDIQGYLEPEEVRALISSADFGIKGRRNRLLLQTLWETGSRISEVVGLKKCKQCKLPASYAVYYVDGVRKESEHCECGEPDYYHEHPLIPKRLVDEKTKVVLYTRKRGEPIKRGVEITRTLMDELYDYVVDKGIEEKERIFSITQRRARQIVKEAGSRAGIDKVGDSLPHPHIFRHSHAIAYIRADNSMEGLRNLQERFKHSNIMTTAHYLQFAREGEQKKIEEIFGGK
jgi:integrase